MKQKPKFFCENCGTEVKSDAKFCNKCGKFFYSVRCPKCGFSGGQSVFLDGCPKCGYAVSSQNRVSQFSTSHKKSFDESLPPWIYVICGIALIIIVVILIRFF